MRAISLEKKNHGTQAGETPEEQRQDTATGEHTKGDYPIGQLARQAGVSTRTVRYYEEIGLLQAARRYAGGRRVFDGDALQRLRFIARLKTLGFSLEEISHLNEVFEVENSTAAMLEVLDGLLGEHMNTLEQRMQEVAALQKEIGNYRHHIQKRLHYLKAR